MCDWNSVGNGSQVCSLSLPDVSAPGGGKPSVRFWLFARESGLRGTEVSLPLFGCTVLLRSRRRQPTSLELADETTSERTCSQRFCGAAGRKWSPCRVGVLIGALLVDYATPDIRDVSPHRRSLHGWRQPFLALPSGSHTTIRAPTADRRMVKRQGQNQVRKRGRCLKNAAAWDA